MQLGTAWFVWHGVVQEVKRVKTTAKKSGKMCGGVVNLCDESGFICVWWGIVPLRIRCVVE